MREHRYAIVVTGRLGDAALVAFEGMKVEYAHGWTTLVADLDQASLFGVLQQVYTLALELVSLTREVP